MRKRRLVRKHRASRRSTTRPRKSFLDRCVSQLTRAVFLLFALVLASTIVREHWQRLGLPIVIAACAAIGLGLAWASLRIRRWHVRRRWLDGVEMQAIDRMRGWEFEKVCCEIFRRSGYSAEVTARTGDQGADLILNGRSGRVVVQTKRQEATVGNSAVQQVHAAKAFYNAARAVVLTNSAYSDAAKKLAAANGVELLDRQDLARMLAKAQHARRPPTPEPAVSPKFSRKQKSKGRTDGTKIGRSNRRPSLSPGLSVR